MSKDTKISITRHPASCIHELNLKNKLIIFNKLYISIPSSYIQLLSYVHTTTWTKQETSTKRHVTFNYYIKKEASHTQFVKLPTYDHA